MERRSVPGDDTIDPVSDLEILGVLVALIVALFVASRHKRGVEPRLPAMIRNVDVAPAQDCPPGTSDRRLARS